MDDGGRNDTTHGRKYVAHEVVDGHAGRGPFRHEFRQHRGCDAEDDHGAETEEKVGNHLGQ